MQTPFLSQISPEGPSFFERGQKGWAVVRCKNLEGVGFKRDHDPFAVNLEPLPQSLKNLLMAEMDTIEVPDGNHRIPESFLN